MHDFRILEIVVEIVAKASGCKAKELYQLGRYPSLCRARETALYLIRQRTKLSFPEIGRTFTGRHHSTIIAAVNHEAQRLERKLPLRADGKTLKQWHDFLLQQIDAAIMAETVQPTLSN